MSPEEADWVKDCFQYFTSTFDRPPTAIELWDWKRLDYRAQDTEPRDGALPI